MTSNNNEFLIETTRQGKVIVRKVSDPNGGTADYVYISNNGNIYKPIIYSGTCTINAKITNLNK